MSLPHLTTKDVMSSAATTCDGNDALHDAQDIMMRHGIRHLPVLQDSALVGVLSDRDVAVALSFKGNNAKNTIASEVCARDIYVTHPGSSLAEVAAEMASHKYGSAVVTDSGDVVGILTTNDACCALAELLTPGSDLLAGRWSPGAGPAALPCLGGSRSRKLWP